VTWTGFWKIFAKTQSTALNTEHSVSKTAEWSWAASTRKIGTGDHLQLPPQLFFHSVKKQAKPRAISANTLDSPVSFIIIVKYGRKNFLIQRQTVADVILSFTI
jgi:hypothetical protein